VSDMGKPVPASQKSAMMAHIQNELSKARANLKSASPRDRRRAENDLMAIEVMQTRYQKDFGKSDMSE
jgi:cob(I)alamin adenosyltransferase